MNQDPYCTLCKNNVVSMQTEKKAISHRKIKRV